MEELSTCERLSLGNCYKKGNAAICVPTGALILGSLVGAILILAGVYDPESLSVDVWDEDLLEDIVPNATLAALCETVDLDALVAQPVNAITCWAYVAFGFACFGISLYDVTRRSREKLGRKVSQPALGLDDSPAMFLRQPLWSVLFGLHLLFLGLTGFLYHASMTNLAYRLDGFAWWATDIFLVVLSLTRLGVDGTPPNSNLCCNASGVLCVVECSSSAKKFGSVFIFLGAMALITFADLGMYLYLDDLKSVDDVEVAGYVILGVAFSGALALHWHRRKDQIDSAWPLFITGVGLFALGYALRWFDAQKGFLCVPESAFQGHSLWHVFSAMALFCIYLFFRGDIFRDELLWLSDDVELLSIARDHVSFRDDAGRVSTLQRQRVPSMSQQSRSRALSGQSHSRSRRSLDSRGGGNRSRNGNEDDSTSVTSLDRAAAGAGIAPALIQSTRGLPAARSSGGDVRRSNGSGDRVASNGRPRTSSTGSAGRTANRNSTGRNSTGRSSVLSGSSSGAGRDTARADAQRLERLRAQRRELEERNQQVRRSLQEKERVYNRVAVEMPALQGRPVSSSRSTSGRSTSGRNSVGRNSASGRNSVGRNSSSGRGSVGRRSAGRGRASSSSDDVVAMWTCASCRFLDNEITQAQCQNCGNARPPLSTMIAVAQPVAEAEPVPELDYGRSDGGGRRQQGRGRSESRSSAGSRRHSSSRHSQSGRSRSRSRSESHSRRRGQSDML